MSEELRFAFLVDYITFFGMREGSVSGTLAFFLLRTCVRDPVWFLAAKKIFSGILIRGLTHPGSPIVYAPPPVHLLSILSIIESRK